MHWPSSFCVSILDIGLLPPQPLADVPHRYINKFPPARVSNTISTVELLSASEETGDNKMYTNPFSRTHSSVRQVIDRILHINENKKANNDGLRRNFSDNSVFSSSMSSNKSSVAGAKRLVSMSH